MDVYVGIEGVNITEHYCIPLEELGTKFKLTLNVKPPQQDVGGQGAPVNGASRAEP